MNKTAAQRVVLSPRRAEFNKLLDNAGLGVSFGASLSVREDDLVMVVRKRRPSGAFYGPDLFQVWAAESDDGKYMIIRYELMILHQDKCPKLLHGYAGHHERMPITRVSKA